MQTLPAPVAATEEFHESDVLWLPDHHHQKKQQQSKGGREQQPRAVPADDHARRRPETSSSAPIAIPVAAMRSCHEGEEEASFVPPHVVAARRWRCPEERAACSMCEGQGRTLKGRDLQCVRAAVLRKTGFLET